MSIDDSPDESPADVSEHPAVKFFVHRFWELMRTFMLWPVGQSGKPRKATPKGVASLLRSQSLYKAPSQRHVYRLARGEVVPTIVDVEHLAGLFGVSPRSFLRVDAPAYDAHIQLRPIPPPIQEISAAGAVQARDRLRQVEQLVPGMKDRWLVASQGSFHLWDLDAMTYSRVPGPSSPSGPFALDLRILLITRVDSWPRVGSRSLVWFDDPADPGGVEQWRQSSRIVSITEVGGNG